MHTHTTVKRKNIGLKEKKEFENPDGSKYDNPFFSAKNKWVYTMIFLENVLIFEKKTDKEKDDRMEGYIYNQGFVGKCSDLSFPFPSIFEYR